MQVESVVSISTAPKPSGLSWRTRTCMKPGGARFWRVAHEFTTQRVAPFKKVIDNVVTGMKERVFYIDSSGSRPPPCIREGKDLLGLVKTVVDAVGSCDRDTGKQFIDSRTGSKRQRYEQARLDLRSQQLSLSELSKLTFFTKWESTCWKEGKMQVPRIVSPRHFGFNYLLGKYIRPVEHKIFDALGTLFTGLPVVTKGMTMQRKAELIIEKLKAGYVAVGLDASRYDQTLREVLLTVEHMVHLGCYNGDRLLAALLKCQLTNRGSAYCRDGTLRANIGPMRCSGDQNTSLGNCIISCLLAKLYFVEHGIEGDVVNDGDDLIMFVPESSLSTLDDLTAWYTKWGLRMKVEPPAYFPEQLEFCQSKPVWTPSGWVMVRNPTKALNTDYAGSEKVASNKCYLEHIRSVGLCGLSMAAGIPVLQAYYEWGVKHGKTGKDREVSGGVHYQARLQRRAGHLSRSAPVDVLTRESFGKAFGIPPDEQLIMEDWFSEASFAAEPFKEHINI